MASLYGIIDTAQDERLYDLVKACPEHVCLFAGKLDPELERTAPFIVRLDPNSVLSDEWQLTGKDQNWGIKCTSGASLSELRRHFRHFLQVQLADGRTVLFRFYDPRVWRRFVATCPHAALLKWFTCVSSFEAELPHGEGLLSCGLLEGGVIIKRVALQPSAIA